MFTNMHTIIPEQELGSYKIEHFELDKKDIYALRMGALFTRTASEYRTAKTGRYVKLTQGKGALKTIWMSDMQMERDTNSDLIKNAHGHVLVAGLGIGMVIPPLQAKQEVKSITIVEQSSEIIQMISPYFNGVGIVQSDIFEFQYDQSYDTIYYDIWPDICEDNLDDMNRLIEQGQKFLNEDGWIMAWRYYDLLGMRYECSGCHGDGQCGQCNGDGDCPHCDEEEKCGSCEGYCEECDGSSYCYECEGAGVDISAIEENSLLPTEGVF